MSAPGVNRPSHPRSCGFSKHTVVSEDKRRGTYTTRPRVRVDMNTKTQILDRAASSLQDVLIKHTRLPYGTDSEKTSRLFVCTRLLDSLCIHCCRSLLSRSGRCKRVTLQKSKHSWGDPDKVLALWVAPYPGRTQVVLFAKGLRIKSWVRSQGRPTTCPVARHSPPGGLNGPLAVREKNLPS